MAELMHRMVMANGIRIHLVEKGKARYDGVFVGFNPTAHTIKASRAFGEAHSIAN